MTTNEWTFALIVLTLFLSPILFVKFVWFKTHSLEGRMVISVNKAGICITEREKTQTLSWDDIWLVKVYLGEVQAQSMGNGIAYSGLKKMLRIRTNKNFYNRRTGTYQIIHPAMDYSIDGLDKSEEELMNAIKKYQPE